MNIAYAGSFLKEGLEASGASLHLIPNGDEPLDARIASLATPIDLVVIELFGAFRNPSGLCRIQAPLALYCVDTPLNAFWLRHTGKLADYLFVDQRDSVSSFRSLGLNAEWLPLCAQESYFQESVPKKHDLIFVGRTDQQRKKRLNLLARVAELTSVYRPAPMPLIESQRVLAESRIALNENFFPGLTLRVFQAAAAGALVFTEANSPGLEEFPELAASLVSYTPHNLAEKLETLLPSPSLCADLAEKAKAECRRAHTSRDRAERLLARVRQKTPMNAREDDATRETRELCGMAKFIMRFGGDLTPVLKRLKEIAANDSINAPLASLAVGHIYAIDNPRRARAAWLEATRDSASPLPWVNVASSAICMGEYADAETAMNRASELLDSPDEPTKGSGEAALLTRLCRLYSACGESVNLGFNKTFSTAVPVTALETALRAWKLAPDPETIDLALACLAPYGVEGELLPRLLDSLRAGVLNDAQILRAAEIAASYYDGAVAETIIKAYKRRKSTR